MPIGKVPIESFQSASQSVSYSAQTIHTVLQCFVDQNLELNENLNYNYIKPTISFENNTLSITEATITDIKLSLSSPSQLGIEEVDLYFINSNSSGVNLSEDVSLPFSFSEPVRLSWQKGEQTKNISLTAFTDSITENAESFTLKIDHFINSSKGQYTEINVSVQDLSGVKTVGIESNDGSMSILSDGKISLDFNVIEGNNKSIIVSLDSPSVLGIEEVDVVFETISASSDDFTTSIPFPIRLYWGVGEKTKTINLDALQDQMFFELDETISIYLSNPSSVSIATAPLVIMPGVVRFPSATITIKNVSYLIQKSRIYFGNIAVQPGKISSSSNYNMLVPYVSYSSGYDASLNNGFLIFDPLGQDTFTPTISTTETINNFNKNKIRIDITNKGLYQTEYNGETWDIDQKLSFTADSLNYFIDLPANMTQTISSSGDTMLMGANYKIEFILSYTGNGPDTTYSYGEFNLKDLSNSLAIDGLFSLGERLFDTFYPNDFEQAPNVYYTITKLSNIGTGRSGSACPLYSFNQSTQENVAVDGIYFIDNYSNTEYVSIDFKLGGGISSTCSTLYNIPFEIIV